MLCENDKDNADYFEEMDLIFVINLIVLYMVDGEKLNGYFLHLYDIEKMLLYI